MHGLSFILALPVWLVGARGGSALLGTSRRASPQAFFNIEIFNLGKPAPPRTTPAAAALLTLVRSGTATRAEIESAIDALPPSPASVSIDGRWRLDYTTEKEVLFLNKTLPLLGANVGIFQDICIGANGVGGGLENLVLFENGHLRVGSSATRSLDVDKRVDFAFDTVSLRVGELQLPLPPVGSGWFETCYCDDAIRVSRDVRGDTQVVSRVGPSQLYATADSPPSLDAALTVLKRAARDRSVSPTAAVSALLYVERSMRAEVKASPAVGAKQLAALDGAWRLVFTTGTLDTQAKLRGAKINYFPLVAVQEFDTKAQPMRISNGIYFENGLPIGAQPTGKGLRFEGEFEWLLPARRLEFDFDKLALTFLGDVSFNLPSGKAAELGAKSGLGSQNNEQLVKGGKKPFFLWSYADGEIATARGGGGGIALWARSEAPAK